MTDKLYRIVPYDYDPEALAIHVGARSMLIAVEPDYEAAYDLLQNKQYVSWNAVEEAVDAALEGNNDGT